MQINCICSRKLPLHCLTLLLVNWLVMNKWNSILYGHCNMVICPCKHTIIYDMTKKEVLSFWLNSTIDDYSKTTLRKALNRLMVPTTYPLVKPRGR